MAGMTREAALSERIARISFSGTMQVAAEAEHLRRQGVDVVDFGAGEPDFPTPEHIKQAAVRAIEENFTRYTSTAGTPELREAVCRRHAADFGTAYELPECVITAGGKHAVFNFIQALVNPGDEVIIPSPYWVTYRDAVLYAGGKPVLAATDEEAGFAVEAGRIEALTGPRTRMLILNFPNNPTGAVLQPVQAKQILELARSCGFYILADECYARLIYHGDLFSIASLAGAAEWVLVAGSVSKAYAMTGWRIGYGLGPEPIVRACIRLQSHSITNPNSIAQRAALEALSGPQDCVARMLAEYQRRRDFVIDRLRQMPGMRVHSPAGTFYAFPNVSELLERSGLSSSAEFARRLLEQEHVVVIPGESFGAPGYVRISFATALTELERGLQRLQRFAERCWTGG